jgi:hypothetical protein
MKQLLIITGPQGSGNHLWSKIAGHTPGVQGWEELTQEYFVHHGREPFRELWRNPGLFSKIEWTEQYYVTNTSCPMGGFKDSLNLTPAFLPQYDNFIAGARDAGFNVVVAVIGRDTNILSHQQQRLRTEVTTPKFLEALDNVLMKYDPVFISTEMLYLYRDRYISQVAKLLNFPLEVDPTVLDEILKEDSNKKYIHPVESHWLDEVHITALKSPPSTAYPSYVERLFKSKN